MPKHPKRPCRYPGCPNLCESGTYCPEHSAGSPDRLRGSATERGYDAKWRRARKRFLRSLRSRNRSRIRWHRRVKRQLLFRRKKPDRRMEIRILMPMEFSRGRRNKLY